MLAESLGIRPGVTAVIGGGGKTTLLRVLGEELSRAGTPVILATTTKFLPFPGIETVSGGERELAEALSRQSLVCAASPWGAGGKLTASRVPVGTLAALAAFVLVEADGSAGLPMKAHAPHEPVIPPESGRTILMVGASGFGKPIRAAAHRPGLYAQLAGCGADEPVTPEIAARVILAEGLGDEIIVNQSETPEARENARRLAENLPLPVFAGSLRRGEIVCVS